MKRKKNIFSYVSPIDILKHYIFDIYQTITTYISYNDICMFMFVSPSIRHFLIGFGRKMVERGANNNVG